MKDKKVTRDDIVHIIYSGTMGDYDKVNAMVELLGIEEPEEKE